MSFEEKQIRESLITVKCKEHGDTIVSTLVCEPEEVPCPKCDERCHVVINGDTMVDFKVYDLIKDL